MFNQSSTYVASPRRQELDKSILAADGVFERVLRQFNGPASHGSGRKEQREDDRKLHCDTVSLSEKLSEGREN